MQSPIENEVSLYCSLHSHFDDVAHNCIGCNLQAQADVISRQLLRLSFSKNEQGLPLPIDLECDYSPFILATDLLLERMDQLVRRIDKELIIKIPEARTCREYRNWSKFFKHPKAFTLAHHPIYELEQQMRPSKFPVIDSKFVKDYYSGTQKDQQLVRKIEHNVQEIRVFLPDPVRVLSDVANYAIWFAKLIRQNPFIREIYFSEYSISEWFEIEPALDVED